MALKDVLGQDRPIEILKKSLRADRLSHAYLFVGEEGIGKAFTAINLAKALNCEKKGDFLEHGLYGDEEIDSCDNCSSCIEIDKEIHPDVLVIKPESDRKKEIDQKKEGNKKKESDEIKIEQIRMAQERFSLRALRGRRKVMIIDNAHTMNISSANALLKTLEEPTEGTIIILISSVPSLLPETILSRCQRIPFGLLRKEVIEGFLISRGLKKDEAYLTASLSDGRIGRALRREEVMTLEGRDNFLILFNSVKEPFFNISPLTEGIAKGEEERLGEVFDWGEIWFRDIVVFKVTGNYDLLINQDKKKEIKDISERLSLNQLQDSFRVIYETAKFIKLRANKHLALDVMMIRLVETLVEN